MPATDTDENQQLCASQARGLIGGSATHLILDILLQVFFGGEIPPWGHLREAPVQRDQLVKGSSRPLEAFIDRLDVFLVASVNRVAGVERPEVNLRDVARIRGSERHRPGVVVRVRFERGP
ncbi:hypothetical protein Tdes44962_MAKER08537 [Teratosphaeria destructans]|uniref:Uncharacterized protein n=1 Tax=Teratosphaeria destructans TaxID=418781 RepID=A0A9W7SWC9_9PEZI|nr:hypothetical protein Tdes44962_MAKER08537 [Teratosphaeria destructans]